MNTKLVSKKVIKYYPYHIGYQKQQVHQLDFDEFCIKQKEPYLKLPYVSLFLVRMQDKAMGIR